MTTRIAVAGAGLIGLRHISAIEAATDACLACVIDPAEAARDVAARHGVPWFSDLAAMPDGIADGVVLATPNAMHVDGGLACVARRVAVLVEKPIATSVVEAGRLVDEQFTDLELAPQVVEEGMKAIAAEVVEEGSRHQEEAPVVSHQIPAGDGHRRGREPLDPFVVAG